MAGAGSSFWNSTSIEPNRQFRWYIDFAGTQNNLGQMRFALKKAAKPTLKIGEVKHKYLNHEFFYPGRVEWDPITVSFASVHSIGAAAPAAPAAPAAASSTSENNPQKTANQILRKILTNSGYIYPNSVNEVKDLKTISKEKAVEQIGNSASGWVSLFQIDAVGANIEQWNLHNPFFTEVKYDTLEYASDEILNIDCTIKYDYAELVIPKK